MLPVRAIGNSRRLSGSMFICGGLDGKLEVSYSAVADRVEPWSDAEGIG